MFDWFSKPKPELKFIEVTDLPLPVVEDEESIRTLLTHPGFVSLNNRLKIVKAILETQLKRTKHKEIRDVDNLQAGIFWCEWLQAEVNKAVSKKKEVQAVNVPAADSDSYKKVYSLIEGI